MLFKDISKCIILYIRLSCARGIPVSSSMNKVIHNKSATHSFSRCYIIVSASYFRFYLLLFELEIRYVYALSFEIGQK
jgi:hypothetical protein